MGIILFHWVPITQRTNNQEKETNHRRKTQHETIRRHHQRRRAVLRHIQGNLPRRIQWCLPQAESQIQIKEGWSDRYCFRRCNWWWWRVRNCGRHRRWSRAPRTYSKKERRYDLGQSLLEGSRSRAEDVRQGWPHSRFQERGHCAGQVYYR